jgi:hypothetical protein
VETVHGINPENDDTNCKSKGSRIYAENARTNRSINTAAALRRRVDGNEIERLFNNIYYILSRISNDKDINVGTISSFDEGDVKFHRLIVPGERVRKFWMEVTVKRPEPTLPSAPDAKPGGSADKLFALCSGFAC